MADRLWSIWRRPTATPGRRRSYHWLIYVAGALLLLVVLLAPLRWAVAIAVAVFVVWWFTDSLSQG